MSHSQTVKVEVKVGEALEAAAKEMNAKNYSSSVGSVRLYDGTYNGMFVHFQGWVYPVVFNERGAIYDDYNGRWGRKDDVTRFQQAYAANAVRIVGMREGNCLEFDTTSGTNRLVGLRHPDGSLIKATFPLGGEALIEVEACAGSACQSHTAPISHALGMATSEILKDEYYQKEQVRERETE
jgi:hypothetical protein